MYRLYSTQKKEEEGTCYTPTSKSKLPETWQILCFVENTKPHLVGLL